MNPLSQSIKLGRSIFFGLLLSAAPLVSAAKDVTIEYLAHSQPDATILLAPPPLAGSAEQAADMEEVRSVYHAATSNAMALAYSEKKFSVFNYTSAVGEFFQASRLPKTTAFF